MGYLFVGSGAGDRTGFDVTIGDFDNDGFQDLLISTRSTDPHLATSVVYMISASDLPALDAADGLLDGIINLDLVGENNGSYTFIADFDPADEEDPRYALECIGDVDGDGLDDFLIGAPEFGHSGEVYLLLAADLDDADLADGVADGEINLSLLGGIGGSYQFTGLDEEAAEFGNSITLAENFDGRENAYLAISAVRSDTANGEDSGAAYLLAFDDLAAADAADGVVDGVIDVDNIADQAGSFKIVGEAEGDSFGRVVTTGDVDGDGRDDLVFGAVLADTENGAGSGAVYILAAQDLVAADDADGARDGHIEASNIAAQENSYKLIGDSRLENTGRSVVSVGDMDGDGRDDLLIGARYGNAGGERAGEAYLLMTSDLDAADAADGQLDGVIDVAHIAAQDSSYQFVGREAGDFAGRRVAVAGDVDGDGITDLLIGARAADGGGEDSGEFYLISGADLEAADLADGTADGVIDLDNIAGHTGSYRFIGQSEGDQLGRSLASAGDVDGDGLDDILIGAYGADTGGLDAGEGYLIFASELADLDAADGTVDGVIDVEFVAAAYDEYPLARDDFFSGTTDAPITGHLFEDNGAGADQSMFGGTLVVLSVEGVLVVDTREGMETDTGTILTVTANGAFTMDTSALDASLGMGETATLTFTYRLGQANAAEVDTATITVEVTRTAGTTDEDDDITGSGHADLIEGGRGDDTIEGKGENDTVTGGLGDDLIKGGNGSDDLQGNVGADTLRGGSGADSLNGGVGDDVLKGGDDDDVLTGGLGDDKIETGDGADVIIFNVGDGNDQVTDFDAAADRVHMDSDFIDWDLPPDQIFETHVVQLDDGSLLLTFGEDNLTLSNTTFAEFRAAVDFV